MCFFQVLHFLFVCIFFQVQQLIETSDKKTQLLAIDSYFYVDPLPTLSFANTPLKKAILYSILSPQTL